MEPTAGTLDALLTEDRRYAPPPAFTAAAIASDAAIYSQADSDPEAFWAEAARELDWTKPWDRVLEWSAPWAKWFIGGELNVSANCVDRHAASERRTKRAIVWEGEDGTERTFTYEDLLREVNQAAAMLLALGIKR